MSRARKLSIRGIRNFGDDSEETIKFSRPLTLIVGQNGVGKTTIIECLRYATTGEFPPGSDRGKGFVHDPALKQSNSTNVRGCIKAEFIDKDGTSVTVNKIIEAQRIANGIKFKSVDNTITKKNLRTGEESAITSRCSDVDAEMRSSLGLSTAILNSIIFCHQDEANWPLGESRMLKERFDEIFDTSRYNKALEILRNLINDKGRELRLMMTEKKGLDILLQEVTSKETKYADYNSRKDESAAKIESLKAELEPIKHQLEEISEQMEKYNSIKSNIEKKEIEMTGIKKQLLNIKNNIKSLFEGDDEDLQAAIKSYDDKVDDISDKMANIEQEITTINYNENKLTQQVSEKKVMIGTLQQQIKDNEKRITNRNSILNELLNRLEMNCLDDNLTNDDIMLTLNQVKNAIEQMENGIKDSQFQQDTQESSKEKEVDICRNKKTKIDVELKQYKKELTEVQDKSHTIRLKLNQADDDRRKLNSIADKLNNITDKIQSLEEKIKSENKSQKIDDNMKHIEIMEEKLHQVDALVSQLQNLSSLTYKLDGLKADIKSKRAELNKLKSNYGDDIKELLDIDELNFSIKLKNKVEFIQKNLTKKIEKLKNEIDNERYKSTSLETSLEHEKQELNKKISQIDGDKQKVQQYCKDYKNYQSELKTQDEKVNKLQKKCGIYTFQNTAYTEYIKEFSSNDPCCPVCSRGFSRLSEAKEVANKLENDLKDHPEKIKKAEAEFNVAKKRYDSLLSLKTTVEGIVKFEEVDKKRMLTSIKDNEEKLNTMQQKITELKEHLVEPERKILLCNKLTGHLALWDQYVNDLEKIDVTCVQLEEEINEKGVSTTKSVDEVLKEREGINKKLRETRLEQANLRKEWAKDESEINAAKDKKSEYLQEQLRITNDLQQVKQLNDQLEELKRNDKRLTETIQQKRKDLVVAEDELDVISKELEELKMKHREEIDQDRRRILGFTKKMDMLNSIQEDISKFLRNNIDDKLNELNGEMKEHESQQEKLKDNKKKREKELSKLREYVSCQETEKRNLNDNLEYREKEKQYKKLANEYKKLKSNLSEIDNQELRERKVDLEEKYRKYDREINIEKGKEEEMKRNVAQLKEELEKDEYKYAKENHKRKWLEQLVTEDVIADLGNYYKALDSALSEYHEERMNTVNETMKKLWNVIYSGTDTTSIQIKTEASTGTTTRRQFNYKLVQKKHGVEMDMKGRCSAGQRVLASIVIRLALAETFCDQCGMLALDEPTTNLDATNSANLAEALYNYIKIRSSYEKAFQLIIITHDENFVSKLKELNTSDYVHELYRGNNGLTKIRNLFDPTIDNSLANSKFGNLNEGEEDDEESDDTDVRRKRAQASSRDKNKGNTGPQKRARSPVASNSRRKQFNFAL